MRKRSTVPGARQSAGQNAFEGDAAAQFHVARFVDDAHAARLDLAQQLVVAAAAGLEWLGNVA